MTVLYIILAVVLIFIATGISGKIKNSRKNRMRVQKQWGKVPDREYSSGDFNSIKNYFDNVKEGSEGFYIDDITWNDLDMDEVFSRLNNTQTDIGEEYLYKLLREPTFDTEQLKQRNDLIEYFRSNKVQREQLQMLLSELGKLRFLNLSEYIYGKRKGTGKSGLFYKILTVIFIISPFLSALFPPAIILFFASIAVNVTMYFRARNHIVGHLQSLGYLVNMISTAKRIGRLKYPQLKEYTEHLKQSSGRISGISIKLFFFMFYTSENYFFEVIKVFFLGEPIAYHSIFNIIDKYRSDFETIYRQLGELESFISIASYRDSLEFYTLPEMRYVEAIDTEKAADDVMPTIDFRELYHPLIPKPVTNSFSTSKSVLITGSNASGKSTFLKSVAINAILAQTVYTCLAKGYKSCFFNVFSSMALRDNLEAEESYYIVEIKSIKRILHGLNSHIPVLCVIDEVLRGTNTVERIAASSEIIGYIAKGNCICLCATHDIELTQILEDRVDNYHFQEFFEDDNIFFDYKLYQGKAYTRNAIKLLKLLGYQQQLVDNAEERAQDFIYNGTWNKYE